jgi:hypothetical protein
MDGRRKGQTSPISLPISLRRYRLSNESHSVETFDSFSCSFLPWKNLEAVDDSSSCEKRPVFRSNDPPHTILDDSKRALERRMVLVVRRVPMRRDYAASPSVYRRVRRGFRRTVNVMPCPTGQESSTRGSPISKMNAGAGGQGKQLL